MENNGHVPNVNYDRSKEYKNGLSRVQRTGLIALGGAAIAYGVMAPYLFKRNALPGQETAQAAIVAKRQIDSFNQPSNTENISGEFFEDPILRKIIENYGHSDSGLRHPNMPFSLKNRLFYQLWSNSERNASDTGLISAQFEIDSQNRLLDSLPYLFHVRHPIGGDPETADFVVSGLYLVDRFLSESYVGSSSNLAHRVMRYLNHVAENVRAREHEDAPSNQWGSYQPNEAVPSFNEIMERWKGDKDLEELVIQLQQRDVHFELGLLANSSYPEEFSGTGKKPEFLVSTLKSSGF